MNIGLDIDNVVTEFDSAILREFLKEDKNKRGSGIVNKKSTHIVRGMFDWSQEEVEQFFADKMEGIAVGLKSRKNCKKYMDKLLADGHKLYLISHRAFPDYAHPEKTTKDWLAKHKIPYHKLVLSESPDKTKECKENSIDIMVDDRVSQCKKMRENGICCILMLTKYNRPEKEGLPFATSWKNLYEEISQWKKRHLILDTDISNEVDDQFALAYLVKSLQGASLDAITIAPFEKTPCANIKSLKDGINLSCQTACSILDMLDAAKFKQKVFGGAEKYFKEAKVTNPATQKIIEICRANTHTTILSIGAITNVALALHFAPDIAAKIDIVWLGGNSFLAQKNDDFNFRQDVDAVREVFNSKAQLVVVPCSNVAAQLSTTTFELQHYLGGLGQAGEYFCQIFERSQKIFAKTAKGRIGQSQNLWDVSVVAYFVNKSWFKVQQVSCPEILDDTSYKFTKNRHKIAFVSDLKRDKIFQDFFIKMGYRQ